MPGLKIKLKTGKKVTIGEAVITLDTINWNDGGVELTIIAPRHIEIQRERQNPHTGPEPVGEKE